MVILNFVFVIGIIQRFRELLTVLTSKCMIVLSTVTTVKTNKPFFIL